MNLSRIKFSLLIFMFYLFDKYVAIIKFTSLNCISLDKSFSEFRQCQLNTHKSGNIAMNIQTHQYQMPFADVHINVYISRKLDIFRPFMFNYTADLCGFMENRKRYPVLKRFFDVTLRFTNFNHTCPINHDIIVRDLFVPDTLLRFMPFPSGDYKTDFKVQVSNRWVMHVEIFLTINATITK